jgi:hypothetical protein
MFGVVRIGFGATICFSWLVITGDGCKSGGVFKRGTPLLSRISSRYDFVIQGPVMPILRASAPTLFLSVPLRTRKVSPRVSIVSRDRDKLP